MKSRVLLSLIPLTLGMVAIAGAAPSTVFHNPTNGVYGEPSNITQREPDAPREEESVVIWAKLGPSFSYDRVAVYYTIDGTSPTGSLGVGTGTTQVVGFPGTMQFVRNEPRSGGGNDDWWKVTLPVSTRTYGQTIKYKISAWTAGENIERFSTYPGTAGEYSYINKLAWPGAGAGSGSPNAGYPGVNFWKEEGVTGNGFMNVMLDQNGTVFDLYYPGAGAVNGVGTRNEGYSGGNDTFPPGLPLDHRGQMHVNQIMAGIRVDGLTHWLSNPSGVSYSSVTQSYVPNSNVLQGSATLTYGGNNIKVDQFDFVPAGITFPNDPSNGQQRSIYIKRFILTNNGATAKTINFYAYGDWALNGGDSYDGATTDTVRKVMVAYDRTQRNVTGGGNNIQPPSEYNPTSFGGYNKDVSLYLAVGLKTVGTPGSAGGTWATDAWSDSSSDQDRGWIGSRITLQPGVPREVNMIVAGAMERPANQTGTYAYYLTPVMDWFASSNTSALQSQTNTYWQNWLNDGVMVDLPDNRYDTLWTRSKLATALHIDGATGSVIAGMHNGAYPFVWPRDAMYAAVSLAKAGHIQEAINCINWMRTTAYRGNEPWGKGFFYQKYTTDGYIVWSSPQVDETAVLPWALWYIYRATGDFSLLSTNYAMVRDSAFAMSSDSTLDNRLRFEEAYNLLYSMSVWEDSFDTFIYSNANVVRGLEDAAKIAQKMGLNAGGSGGGYFADQSNFNGRASLVRSGVNARLDWNLENTDISQMGIVYPFQVISPIDNRAGVVERRINGTQNDANGNNHPLLISGGDWDGLVNRYWGDNYWNGGPWFLSTLWYGLFYSEKADYEQGPATINILKDKVDRLFNYVGPLGLGSEQIAASFSQVYPDFRIQTAWPNAWESMSTYMDSVMAFLDYEPAENSLNLSPKLPTGWTQMTYTGLRQSGKRFDIQVKEALKWQQTSIKNRTGGPLNFSVTMKVPPGKSPIRATVNGTPVTFTTNSLSNQVTINSALATAPNSVTSVRIEYTTSTNGVTPSVAL